MSEQSAKALTMTLILGSLLVIGIGVGVALAGQWFGWLIAGFGVLDAATIPFVLRAVGSRRRSGAGGDLTRGEPGAIGGGEGADPTADPSYNPYARED